MLEIYRNPSLKKVLPVWYTESGLVGKGCRKGIWVIFKLSCRDKLLVCPWQMWKADEMGRGESNIPSLQVCWGERALQRSHIWQSFVNTQEKSGRKPFGSCARWKNKNHASHIHTALIQWLQHSLYSPNVSLFREKYVCIQYVFFSWLLFLNAVACLGNISECIYTWFFPSKWILGPTFENQNHSSIAWYFGLENQ